MPSIVYWEGESSSSFNVLWSIWTPLGGGHLSGHVWLAGSLLSGAQVQPFSSTAVLGFILASCSEQNKITRGSRDSRRAKTLLSKAIWTLGHFQSAHHRTNACRLWLAKFFFYLGICATSTSHWGDSCPKPCAHEAGEPVLCLKLLGQRRALRFLSSPWPHCVSCSWAGSLLLQSPTVGASTRALLSLLWSLLAICATQCCFSLDHVCSVDGYFK